VPGLSLSLPPDAFRSLEQGLWDRACVTGYPQGNAFGCASCARSGSVAEQTRSCLLAGFFEIRSESVRCRHRKYRRRYLGYQVDDLTGWVDRTPFPPGRLGNPREIRLHGLWLCSTMSWRQVAFFSDLAVTEQLQRELAGTASASAYHLCRCSWPATQNTFTRSPKSHRDGIGLHRKH